MKTTSSDVARRRTSEVGPEETHLDCKNSTEALTRSATSGETSTLPSVVLAVLTTSPRVRAYPLRLRVESRLPASVRSCWTTLSWVSFSLGMRAAAEVEEVEVGEGLLCPFVRVAGRTEARSMVIGTVGKCLQVCERGREEKEKRKAGDEAEFGMWGFVDLVRGRTAALCLLHDARCTARR